MPAKHSAAKRKAQNKPKPKSEHHIARNGASPTMSHLSPTLEKCIARILLLRYRSDICRLFSMHLYHMCDEMLPCIVQECILHTSPGWVANHAKDEQFKQFFRSVIAMDLRECGDRLGTKSLLWSYTAIRQFAISKDIRICKKLGLHSHHLIPHLAEMQAHLAMLESTPLEFRKPAHLPPPSIGWKQSEKTLEIAASRLKAPSKLKDAWQDWRKKAHRGYHALIETVWEVANEFHVEGYGLILKDKFEKQYCDCGCTTDHLGEIFEKTILKEEETSGKRQGKGREWDGRGWGIEGWNTEEEEDLWDFELDHEASIQAEEAMTAEQYIRFRYIRAEKEKEAGNLHFRHGEYEKAIQRYKKSIKYEPELPYYHLNLAAAYLKLSQWSEAEAESTAALGQHSCCKGYWRRAKARKELGRTEDAIQDLKTLLSIQPDNDEAATELASLVSVVSGNTKDPFNEADLGPSSSRAANSQAGTSSPELSPGSSTSVELPFVIHEADYVKLKITTQPPTGGDFEAELSTLSYPTWYSCVVQRA